MKYSLRSLMIVVLVAPPLLAMGYFGWQKLRLENRQSIDPMFVFTPCETDGSDDDWGPALEEFRKTGKVPPIETLPGWKEEEPKDTP